MTRIPSLPCSITALAVLALPIVAHAQARPVARQLGPVVATSVEALGALSAVRQLPGGMVLVNDPARLRVLLMDSALKVVKVVADSTSNTQNSYGARAGGLIAYRGDSTLFVDPVSLSMLVIDPSGTIVRTMAAPRPADVVWLVGGPLGNPGFDAQGRLVYRTPVRPRGGDMAQPQTGSSLVVSPDSAPLIRFDLVTRKLDTAAFIKVPVQRMNVIRTATNMSMSSVINPLPVIDDWAVLPDGAIAIMRGREYRLDVLAADGTRSSGEKIAFDWQRLTEEDKSRIVDSTRKVMEVNRAGGGGLVLGGGGSPASITGGGGGGMVVTMSREGPGGERTTTIGGPPPAGVSLPPLVFVQPSELPDYRPAFSAGAMRADADGRLWLRTVPTKPLAGGAEYDVIGRDGRLVERVAIPMGSTIVGFGAGGNVYLGVRDASGVRVIRARVR